MSRGLNVSRPLIANMIQLIHISDFFKWKNIYITTFRVAHWDTLDDKSCVLVCRGKIFSSVLMASVIHVHFSQLVDHCVT